jgi:parallel beta-helix repeat protein
MGGARLVPVKAISVLSAVAALVVPAAAQGAQVSCGDAVTQDTTLTDDLRGCANDGLVVNGDVTLDLNGHSVSGRGGGAGIRIDGGSTATVTNGTIRGFGIGIAKFTTMNLGVVDVKVLSNGTGISAFDAGGALSVTASDISRNTSNGVLLANTDAVTVDGNRITANGNWGIQVDRFAEPTVISNNLITHNGGGISVRDATTRILNNVASHNAGDGIAVVDTTSLFFPYLIAGNTANKNGGFGITFTGVAVGPNGERVDGGGNSAKGNGAQTQCVSIVCT